MKQEYDDREPKITLSVDQNDIELFVQFMLKAYFGSKTFASIF